MLVLVWGALQPLHASSKDITNETGSTKIKLVVNKDLKIERVHASTQIVVGESEAQKLLKLHKIDKSLHENELPYLLKRLPQSQPTPLKT